MNDPDYRKPLWIALIIILLLWFLTGCASTGPQVVTKPEVKYIQIPDSLLKKCIATAPPSVKDYTSYSFKQREDVLTVYTTNLLKDIKNCDDVITAIKEFQAQQLKIMKESK